MVESISSQTHTGPLGVRELADSDLLERAHEVDPVEGPGLRTPERDQRGENYLAEPTHDSALPSWSFLIGAHGLPSLRCGLAAAGDAVRTGGTSCLTRESARLSTRRTLLDGASQRHRRLANTQLAGRARIEASRDREARLTHARIAYRCRVAGRLRGRIARPEVDE